MDGLDLLKQHWNKDNNFPKIEKEELQVMLHRSSSSIVKWIFIICCLEFGLSIVFYFFYPAEKEDYFFFTIVDSIYNIIFYGFIGYFIYKFYTLLVQIKSTNSTKKLMESILAVRTNAHQYIRFNILAASVAFGILFIQLMTEEYLSEDGWGKMVFMVVTAAILFTIFGFLFIALMKLYFKVLYGFLLKKLNKNYEELTRLEEGDTN